MHIPPGAESSQPTDEATNMPIVDYRQSYIYECGFAGCLPLQAIGDQELDASGHNHP